MRRTLRDAWTIAEKDCREYWRDGRFRWASALLAIVLMVAAATGWAGTTATARLHAEAERAEREASLDKGAMNPHAAAHYGAFVFKPVEPLSAIDPGLTPYVGVSVFLEAHEQHAARHRPAADATAARLLGELSVAGALQVLVPLMIVTLGFGAFAGERERGTLRLMASMGAGRRSLILGKLAGCVLPLAAVLIPVTALASAFMVFSGSAVGDADAYLRAGLLLGVYLLYFVLWIAIALIASLRARTSSGALVTLLAIWFVACLVAPRLASAAATSLHRSPTAAEFAVAVQGARDRLPLWPDRVAGVEERFLSGDLAATPDLPSNPEVIALVDAERDESALYDAAFEHLLDAHERQARAYERIGVWVPTLALQTISMSLAGTDYHLHRRFLDAARDYRAAFLALLNSELVEYRELDTFDYTRGRELWERIPAFAFEPPVAVASPQRPALIGLSLWLLLATAVLGWSITRMAVA